MNWKKRYSYLWDGSSEGWVLCHSNSENPIEKPEYLIFNEKTNQILLIDDDLIANKVEEIMLEKKVLIKTSSEMKKNLKFKDQIKN